MNKQFVNNNNINKNTTYFYLSHFEEDDGLTYLKLNYYSKPIVGNILDKENDIN
jgi:hypothetical protein